MLELESFVSLGAARVGKVSSIGAEIFSSSPSLGESVRRGCCVVCCEGCLDGGGCWSLNSFPSGGGGSVPVMMIPVVGFQNTKLFQGC